MNDWVLKIDNLSVGFGIAGQARPVTEGVSLTIARGERWLWWEKVARENP